MNKFGLDAPVDVGTAGVVAEQRKPMLVMDTRYNYFMKNLPMWKQLVRYRVYSIILLAVGLYLLFVQPLLAVVALFLCTYCYKMYKLRKMRTLQSTRTVIIGH